MNSPKLFKFIHRTLVSLFYFSMLLMVLGTMSCQTSSKDPLQFHVAPHLGQTVGEAWAGTDSLLITNGLFNPGITSHLWWMKVKIQSTKNEPGKYFFKLNNPHINRLDIYLDGSDTATWILGDNFPFAQRPFLNRDFVIPMDLAAFESKNLLISIDKIGETLMVEPKLLTENEFLQMSSSENIFMGMIIGWMAIIFFSACFFAFNLREISAFIYGLFIFSSAFWVFSHWGLGFQYLWPENLVWAGKVRPMFNLITNILFLTLIISFFPPLKKNSKLIYSIYFVIGFNLFVIINLALLPYSYFPLDLRILFLRLIFVFSGLMTFLIVLYLIQQIRAEIPFSGYYLLGISFLVVIHVLMQFHQSGISIGVPNSIFDFSSSIAILIETIFITAAFFGRAASYKKEKEQLAIEILVKEKKVADQLIQVQEEERSRLARDLHDSIGGMLSSIYLQANKIEKQSAPSEETTHLKQLIKQSIEEARGLSHNLTPPHLDELGLEKTLHNLVQSVSEQNDIKVKYFYNVNIPLTKPVELMLYRICSELLYNIIKHAKATEALVQLTSDDNNLEIILEDDGKGMDTQKTIHGIGLRNIRERVNYLKGVLHIDSNEHGTTFIIQAPLKS